MTLLVPEVGSGNCPAFGEISGSCLRIKWKSMALPV